MNEFEIMVPSLRFLFLLFVPSVPPTLGTIFSQKNCDCKFHPGSAFSSSLAKV